VPTLMEAEFASNVGYETPKFKTWQCWVIPGVKLKMIYSNGLFREDTLAADRATVLWRNPGGSSGDRTYRSEGSVIRRISRNDNGTVNETDVKLDLSYDPETLGRFKGYLCES